MSDFIQYQLQEATMGSVLLQDSEKDKKLVETIQEQIEFNSRKTIFREINKTFFQLIKPNDPNISHGTISLDPGLIGANSGATLTFTIPSTVAGVGDLIFMNPPNTIEAGLIYQGAAVTSVVAPNATVTVRLYNATSAGIDGAALTWFWIKMPVATPFMASIDNVDAFEFADAVERIVSHDIIMPPELQLTALKFIWSSSATSGNLRWNVQFLEGGEGEGVAARSFTTASNNTATNSTANRYTFTDILKDEDIARIKKSNKWNVVFMREGDHVNDTLSNAMHYYGLLAIFK